MKESLEKAMKEFSEKPGLITTALEEVGELEVIPFNIPSLDNITGIGGVPRGRITEIYGMDGTFKTTFTLYLIRAAQQAGGMCVFVDAEFAFSPEYAERLGVDLGKLILVHPSSAEEAFNVIEKLTDTGEIALVVIDSIAALSPEAEQQNSFGASNMGVMARLMSQMFRKTVSKIGASNTSLVIINQLREKLGSYVPTKTTTGGNAAAFYASLRLEISKSAIKEGTDVKGVTLKVKTAKNKLSEPFKITEIEAIFGEGIDIMKDSINLGVEKGVIQKAGAGWMMYEGTKIQGAAKMKTFFEDNPEAYTEFVKKLK